MTQAKYKLDVSRDVDTDEPGTFILHLPKGFKLFYENCHTIGFDTMKELRSYAKSSVVQCSCKECLK